MKTSFFAVSTKIQTKEDKLALTDSTIIPESLEMICFLRSLLLELKGRVTTDGFSSEQEEIYFFREVKPLVLSKLIFYNKVFRIETACPCDSVTLVEDYFKDILETIKIEYKQYCLHSDFYRYYKAARKDRDTVYFRLGNIDFQEGINSFMFEVDSDFSTYYDYKLARILHLELLSVYITNRLDALRERDPLGQGGKLFAELVWTNSSNALVELIYALHASGSISNGKLGIKKLGAISNDIFDVKLNDLHHAFYRMKCRADSRTLFLDQLKHTLENYMDKTL